jgi:hypothetical protein
MGSDPKPLHDAETRPNAALVKAAKRYKKKLG